MKKVHYIKKRALFILFGKGRHPCLIQPVSAVIDAAVRVIVGVRERGGAYRDFSGEFTAEQRVIPTE